jgi:diguanylate cyclase (GGDEF)-like protein/PAS domain S-box-containing protein
MDETRRSGVTCHQGVCSVAGVTGDSASLAESARTGGGQIRGRFLGVPAPQAILTRDGRFAEVNGALSGALGTSPERLVGAASSEFLHPDDRSRARDEFLELLAGRVPSLASVRRYLLPDGEIGYGLTTMALLPERGPGEPGVVVALVQDVTGEQLAHNRAAEALAQLKQVERRFRALVTRSADVAIVVDAKAMITFCSPAVTEVFGYDPAQVVGRSGFEFVHPDDVEVAAGSLAHALAEPGLTPSVTLRVRSADGSYAWTEEVATNLLDDPHVDGFIVNVRNIGDRVATERKYRDIVETAQEGIWIVDATGRTTFANQRLASMLGGQIDDVLGRTPMELATAQFASVFSAQLEARQRGEPGRYEAELSRSDGSVVNVLVSAQPCLDDAGAFTGAHAMITDITSLKALERQLTHRALHDDLTGLANRALLTDRLEHMLTSLGRRDRLAALLMIDVDGFRRVNDSYGHDRGDDLLIQVAERIASALRADDTAARIGGDQFAALCEELHDRKEAGDIARRVLAAIAEPMTVGNDTLVLTASVGIAYTPADTAATLLRDADIALHRAQGCGGARTTIFDPTEPQTARRDLVLTHDLQRALETSEVEVHYQPIIALDDQRVCGAEALARWRHPRYGWLQPEAFIPIAEQAGLIGPLDCKVIASACEQTAQWLSEGSVADDFALAVNVSAAHLGDPCLLNCIDASLSQANLPPHHLTVEVTETALITDSDHVRQTLSVLRERGVMVALDDFGTGYSSLSYLKSIPADRLKIDRSFVGGLGDQGDDAAIVASILSLADAVGMHCIAEGIESVEQLSALTHLGCSYGQGFLWSGAVGANEFPQVSRDIVPALPSRPPTTRRRAHWVANVDARTQAHIADLHDDGASLQTIAAALNRCGRRTPRGTRWHAASVAQVIASSPPLRQGAASRTGT